MEKKQISEIDVRKEFQVFDQRMIGISHYRLIMPYEKRRFKNDFKLIPPDRKVKNISAKVSYVFKAFDPTNLLEAVVHVRLNGEGQSWVLIREDGEAKYFARPFRYRNTENYFLRLARYAWIAMYRVSHRPRCPKCGRYMEIAKRKKYIRARFWICENKEVHTKSERADWDYGLPPKAKAFLKIRRKKWASYRVERVKSGKTVHMAQLKRKTWTFSELGVGVGIHGWKNLDSNVKI